MSPDSLTAWRKRLRLSKVGAARALGCSAVTVLKYERGITPIPRYIALACAAIALGVPPHG